MFFYFIENSYPALVTDLMRLVQHVVIKKIELEERGMSLSTGSLKPYVISKYLGTVSYVT